MQFLDGIIHWEFLNEPMTKWFLFFGALLAISFAWTGILSFVA